MRYRWGILFVSLGLLLMVGVTCGKKAPPFLPERVMPLKVTQLKAGWKKGTIVLSGIIAGPQGSPRGDRDVTGCRVYHARYTKDNAPCEECPVHYEGFKLIKGEVIKTEGFYCPVPGIEKKGIHFFEVRLVGSDGAVGAPSNRARLVIGD